jgi:hypothetical protein
MDTVSCVVVGRMRKAVFKSSTSKLSRNKSILRYSPTWTDVDALDDDEDDEGAIVGVELVSHVSQTTLWKLNGYCRIAK